MADRAELSPPALRRAFAHLPSAVTVVAALVDGAPSGLVASSFTSVSLVPPLVSVCMAHTSSTWPALRRSGRLGISVLGADQEPIARAVAGSRERRFATVDWFSPGGLGVLVRGAPLTLECSISAEVPAGDHDIVVLAVLAARTRPGAEPMVFHGGAFRGLSEAIGAGTGTGTAGPRSRRPDPARGAPSPSP
jgi:flavin reductase (DIM6/NTAB) family NADH-FMN oxidoreductase RutF